MKKVIVWLLVLALTAAVSIGATLAYLTDTDEDVNVMTLGKVKIDQLEYERIDDETKDEDATVQEFHDNKPLYPGVYEDGFDFGTEDNYVNWDRIGKDDYISGIWNPDEINNEVDKMVFVKNKGDYDAYVRSVFAFEAGNYETLEQFRKMVHLNLNETDYTWEWTETPVTIGESTYFVATATYNKVLAPGALTEISLGQIALDKTATNEDVAAFGDTYQVLVKSQGIQSQGFTDADTALNEGFGVVDAKNIPWENDSPIKGTDLRTALHNLNGDTTQVITTKVSNVIFALNEEYPEIVEGCKGTLVDVEQDVPVYAYYVPNGSNYDVYFLADDVIYSPKDSSSLYQGMSALKTVDTDNYDVSRVETMQKMFRECSKLTTLDTTDWDTSKVTNMAQTFYKCGALREIPGLEDWNTGAATAMNSMFRECGVKGDLDLTGWDVSNVTTMAQMFYKAPNMVSLDATGWDTGAVGRMDYMFTACGALQSVDAAGWDTSEVTNMYAMLANCGELLTVDATGWTNEKLTNAYGVFMDDYKLVEIIGTESWKFGSVTDMSWMFQNTAITELDVSNWDLSTAEKMPGVFFECNDLVTLTGTENWRLTSVQDMYGTFYANYKLQALNTTDWGLGNCIALDNTFRGCYGLTTLDVSKWDVSNVKVIKSCFSGFGQNEGNMNLDNLDMSKWDLSSVEDMRWMFYGCGQLKEVDFSGCTNLPNLTDMHHIFADCYKLEKVNFSGWETPNLVNMDAIFNNCESLKSVDMSMFETSNVYYFSQLFEACYSLEEVIGLENWDTAKGDNFSEMFSGCSKLKELDLSSFDTRNANHLAEGDWVFLRFITGCTGLEKITFGPYFDFDGVGCADGYRFVMPAATGVEGWDGYWYNADTGEKYLPSEIPELTAATYVAVNPANP